VSGFTYDVAVVGSGFGGSVAALRLAEKGYRVVVLEAGRRFADDEHAVTSWRLHRFLFAPRLGLRGIQRIHRLRDVVVLAGAGVGGGSLVYANTLYQPDDAFFDDPQWRDITDWRAELEPYYGQARRMLGVVDNPCLTPADEVMRGVAHQLGADGTFRLTPVGVFFDEPGSTVPDPYFGGAGPARTGCLECGGCMTGCRHGAKNTLVKNYLHLAEGLGARMVADTTVTAVRTQEQGGFVVETVPSGSWLRTRRSTFLAEHVVVAAGAYGTQSLLHRMRDGGELPGLSARLGELTRTNSEALLGAVAPVGTPTDYSRGVAITSSIRTDDGTHLEPVRYGHGSSFMALLSTVLPDGDGGGSRLRQWARAVRRDPARLARVYDLRGWAERAVILLAMQSRDNSVSVVTRRGLFGRRMTSEPGHGEPNPPYLPAADDVARRAAALMGGEAGGNLGELVGAPMTAHFIGGCVIGDSADTGVVDPYLRAYGHPGLHVADGSAVSANLGVNPALTITAQAERAFALWPNRGEPDSRPPLGQSYRPVAPVAPRQPAVPSDAPGALRLQ
jgi:cholesterol oxidase